VFGASDADRFQLGNGAVDGRDDPHPRLGIARVDIGDAAGKFAGLTGLRRQSESSRRAVTERRKNFLLGGRKRHLGA
jgi:hypothetical protein